MRRLFDGYPLLLRWQFLRYRSTLVMLVGLQLFLGIGVVYGLSYLIPHIDAKTALYLTTGAPTLNLLIIGLNVVPGEVSLEKTTGQHQYVAALPVGRLAPPLSSVTFWLAASLPGMAASLVVAAFRFHLHFRVGWLLAPAIVLVALGSSSVGYAMAAAIRPQVLQTVNSFVGVLLLLFSPINFPLSRLPGWLQAIQRLLPVKYMADLVRNGLTGAGAGGSGKAFLVVGAWCAAALVVTAQLATRRT